MVEGLFGVRMGVRTGHVGVFAKIRPGFIYYESALTQPGRYRSEESHPLRR